MLFRGIIADFKPRKDYTAFTTLSLLQEWLKLSLYNRERLFVYQALKTRASGIDQLTYCLNDKERKKFKLKNKKERRQFRLSEDEFIIFCNADVIHRVALRFIYLIAATWPIFLFGTFVLIEKFGFKLFLYTESELRAVLVVSGLGWGILFLLARMFNLFGTSLFVTNFGIGSCVTLFGRINLFFSYLALERAIILADIIIAMGAVTIFGVTAHIWRINDNLRCKFCLPFKESFIFLEALIVLAGERGGSIFVPAVKAKGRIKNGPKSDFSYQFSKCDLTALPDWYSGVITALENKKSLDNQQYQLLSMARFICGSNGIIKDESYEKIRNKLAEEAIFITKFHPSKVSNLTFNNETAYFTDRGLVITDSSLRIKRGLYPYVSIRLERFNYNINIYNKKSFIFGIYCTGYWHAFNYALPFPFMETLQLLGCLEHTSNIMLEDDFGVFYLPDQKEERGQE